MTDGYDRGIEDEICSIVDQKNERFETPASFVKAVKIVNLTGLRGYYMSGLVEALKISLIS